MHINNTLEVIEPLNAIDGNTMARYKPYSYEAAGGVPLRRYLKYCLPNT